MPEVLPALRLERQEIAVTVAVSVLAGAEKGLWTRDGPSPAGMVALEQMMSPILYIRCKLSLALPMRVAEERQLHHDHGRAIGPEARGRARSSV